MTRTPDDSNPFGTPRSASRRLVAITSAVALLLVLAVTLYLTKDSSAAESEPGHDHAAMTAAQAASPVTLTSEQAERIGVTYAPVTLAPMGREIRTVGEVTFDETRVRAISPKIEGWVEQLHVNYVGQLVTAGQPLLTIYSPMLVAAQEELLLAARLMQDVDAGSAEARQGAADLLASSRRRLRYWDIPAGDIAAIERSGQVRRVLTIRAPHGGYVLEKNVLAGQKVMMGDALYKVADLSTIWIEGEVFEQDLAAMRLGQPVIAELDAAPGRSWKGRIAYVYPTVNPETRTTRVRVALPNPGLQFKPGMYATLRIDGTAAANVLTVPRSAVLATGTRSLVFVRRADGTLEPRDVTVGVANDERIAILAGLAVGETVVASATFLVDAESNLGSLFGGAGAPPAASPQPGAAPAASSPAADPHAGHR